jgi:hypothetical protein
MQIPLSSGDNQTERFHQLIGNQPAILSSQRPQLKSGLPMLHADAGLNMQGSDKLRCS